MKTVLLLTACLVCMSARAQRRGVYKDVAIALQQSDKVRVLDLRGQELVSLPASLNSLQNVEVILLGMKLRDLWFYPPAWKNNSILSAFQQEVICIYRAESGRRILLLQ